jgi:hypothetical protein
VGNNKQTWRRWPEKRLWSQQLRALHSLFSLFASECADMPKEDLRAVRLAWASENIGRHISSFVELTVGEAVQLIDLLKKALGQEVKQVSRPAWRRPRDRQAALAAGTHGRRNRPVKMEIMATREDIEEVDQLRERVGMTRENFETWLASRSSPLGRRGAVLRTISDCNRVRWALKSMLRRAG